MNNKREQKTRWQRFCAWVEGDREPKVRTLFAMEQHFPRGFRGLKKRWKAKPHPRKTWNWYPAAAVLICLLLTGALLAAVLALPEAAGSNGEAGNGTTQVLSDKDNGTEAESILSYRGFDTLGESCVLLLAVVCVSGLLEGSAAEKKAGGRKSAPRWTPLARRTAKCAALLLLPLGTVILLHSESNPGGEFSGGSILGVGLILCMREFDTERARRVLMRRWDVALRTVCLLLFMLLYGMGIYAGANDLPDPLRQTGILSDLAVGLAVAAVMTGLYRAFAEEDTAKWLPGPKTGPGDPAGAVRETADI